MDFYYFKSVSQIIFDNFGFPLVFKKNKNKRKNMKHLFTALSSALLFFSGIFLTNFIGAEEISAQKVIKLNATVSDPINLAISPFGEKTPYILRGRVSGTKLSRPVELITFEISGKNNESLWQKQFPWEKSFQKDGGEVLIRFEHNLKGLNIQGKNRLTVKFIDEKNRITAITSKEVSFPKDKKNTPSEISNLQIEKEEKNVSVQVDFENMGKTDEFYAQVKVYKDPTRLREVEEVKTPILNIKTGEKSTFSATFSAPKSPRFYVVDVQIFREDDTPQSGILSGGFLVDGLFAIIEFSEIDAEQLEKGDVAELNISGTINAYTENLSANISVRTQEEDPENASEFFNESFDIQIDEYRSFSETFSIPVQTQTKQLWAKVQIKKGRQILEEQTVSSKKHFPENSELLTDFIKNPFEKQLQVSKERKMKALLGGGIGILILIVFIVILTKMNRNKQTLSILLFIFCLFGIHQAEASTIVYPLFDYYRTEGLPEGEDFNLVNVEGEITGGAGILNVGEEYATQFEMTRTVDSQALTVDGENFSVEETDKFSVIFDAKDAKLISEPEVLDSEYSLSKVILTETTTSTVIEIDVTLIFSIINEAPKVRFEMKSVDDKTLFDPTGVDFNALYKGEDTTSYHELNPNYQAGPSGDPNHYIENPEDFVPDVIDHHFTKQTLTAQIRCGTAASEEDLGDINSDTDICSGDSPDQEEIEIKGNFCNDANECDATGARIFKICNLVGNCSVADGSTDISVKNFDTQPPSIGSSEISYSGQGESRTDNSPLAAFSDYIFKILNVYDQETVDNTDLHTNACGLPSEVDMTDYDDYFFEKTENLGGTPTQVCHPKHIPCSVSANARGVREYITKDSGSWEEIILDDLSCSNQCPVGEVPAFCSDDDKIENGGDGIKRCCEVDTCTQFFPLCFPFTVQ